MLISGFLSYDEAHQYDRQLYAIGAPLSGLLTRCRSLIVSEQNLRLLGTSYSYRDYEVFFEQQIAPVEVPKNLQIDEPEMIELEQESGNSNPQETEGANPQSVGNPNEPGQQPPTDDFDLGLPPLPQQQQQMQQHPHTDDFELPPLPQQQQQTQQPQTDDFDQPAMPQQQQQTQQQNDIEEFDEDFWR